jgi:hypothetical protein
MSEPYLQKNFPPLEMAFLITTISILRYRIPYILLKRPTFQEKLTSIL